MNGMNEKLVDFFSRRAGIRDKLLFPGTFRDYAKEIILSSNQVSDNELLTKSIIGEAQRLLGKEISTDMLYNQLTRFPFISYADHHGLLNYNLLYNTNILYSLIIREIKLPFIVVLATGNIPLKNISYPRGFYFKRKKFNFFETRYRDIPVFLIDGLKAVESNRIESFIKNTKGNLNNEENNFLNYLFFDCLNIEDGTEKFSTFSDQITFLNHNIWKYFFDIGLRENIPEIIYIQANNVVLDILLFEINRNDSLVNLILFNKEVRKIYIKNFSGTKCCWGDNIGSQFFWAIDKKNRPISLFIDESNNSLVGNDFMVLIEKEAIIDALKTKKIFPTLFFDLLIITFISRYVALGGLNQIEYLPKMQAAHIKSLQEIGMPELAEKFAKPVASGLICGMFPFDFDSAIDMIWHYNSHDGKFNGNLDRGITQEDLDRILDTPFTDLVATGIDKTLEMM